jgi:putative N-acetylmannosamine-6-phosphate epimerase
MENSKKYHTVGTLTKSNIKVVEEGKIDTPNTQIHDCSLS